MGVPGGAVAAGEWGEPIGGRVAHGSPAGEGARVLGGADRRPRGQVVLRPGLHCGSNGRLPKDAGDLVSSGRRVGCRGAVRRLQGGGTRGEDSLDLVRDGDQGGRTDRTAVNGSRKGGERGGWSSCAHARTSAHAHAQKMLFLTHARGEGGEGGSRGEEAGSKVNSVYLCAVQLWVIFSFPLFVSQVFCIEQILT